MSLSEQQPPDNGTPDHLGEGPLHGYTGDRAPHERPPRVPAGITVAVSREAGSRGSTLARRAAQEELIRHEVLGNLSPEQTAWVNQQVSALVEEKALNRLPGVLDLARMVL